MQRLVAPEAGLLEAAKGYADAALVETIDPNAPGAKPLRGTQGNIYVARPHRRGEAVQRVVGIGRNRWSIALFGTNLANKRALLSIDNTIFAWQQPDLTRATANQPRTIGIEYQSRF